MEDIDIYEVKEFNNLILTSHHLENSNIVKKFLNSNIDSDEIYKLSLSISRILYTNKIIVNNQRLSPIILTQHKIEQVLNNIKEVVYIINDAKIEKNNILDVISVLKIFERITRVSVNNETSILHTTSIGELVIFKDIEPEWDDLISNIDDFL